MTVSKYIFLNTSLKLYLVYAYIFKNLVCVYVCVYIIYVMYIMHVIYIYYIYYSYIVIVHLAYNSIFFFKFELRENCEEQKPYAIRSTLDAARVLHLLLNTQMKYIKSNENHVFSWCFYFLYYPIKTKMVVLPNFVIFFIGQPYWLIFSWLLYDTLSQNTRSFSESPDIEWPSA